MPSEEQDNGWKIEKGEFLNHASKRTPGKEVEIYIDKEDIEVRVEEGRGYLSQNCTAYVPVEIMIEMLRHAGYVITR